MATIAQLLADLAALAHEVKRKNHDVRLAIDRATAESRKLPSSTVISDIPGAQIAICLPFITSLSSGNAKLVNYSLLVLARLAALRSLQPDQVLLIIDSLHSLEIPGQSLETQLKILQTSPPLAQNYSLDREHFLRLAAVCSRLASSHEVAVANSASATLQQVVSSLYEKLRNHIPEVSAKTTVSVYTDRSSEKAQSFQVDELELECFYVFLDLSSVVDGAHLDYFDPAEISIRPKSALEIIENIVTLYGDVFDTHEELAALLSDKTVPVLLKVLNAKSLTFPMASRTLRILQVLVGSHMDKLQDESEIIISSANHILLDATSRGGPESTASHSSGNLPYWEKVLVLEFYRGLFSNFSSIRQIYEVYDSNPKKKNVLHEVLSVLDNHLLNNYSQFFSGVTIQVPQSGANQLSKQSSTVKVAIIDHLDKAEPPANIPSFYSVHLIFRLLVTFAEGVSDFVTNLSANATSEISEADVEFITSMNEEVFPELFHLFKKYLYCSMDSEYFHTCIRALQKYTHAIGLLGLSSLRDGLLLTLSDCCIKNCPPDEAKKNGASQLLSIGESIVETISSSIQSPAIVSPSLNLVSQVSERSSNAKSPGDDILLGLRTFNSRQVVCFRALSNLALSLGSTLQNSWKIIWITFQWVDYFLRGPDQFSGSQKDIKKYGEPRLTSQDISNLEASNARLFESIRDYQQSSYRELIFVLTELYDSTSGNKTDKVIPLETCPFNKTYFIDQLVVVAELDPETFLFDQEDTWQMLISYFTTLGTNRSITYGVRNYLVQSFTSMIVNVTEQGFRNRDEESEFALAEKSLEALLTFLNSLLALGRPQELLVLNCETELHLTVLNTVHGLIDGFVEKYQKSWDLVFEILNTAFINTQDSTDDGKLNRKIASLIATSFETLKLILDEFLTALPSSQLKSLIDTLLNFCSQEYDLNISFSSVSYFWLISDCINTKIENQEQKVSNTDLESLRSMADLESLLESSSDSLTVDQSLNIYLLAQLSHISTDKRARVREGAIQTLFQIIDVQGKRLPSWNMVYNIVLPELLNLSVCSDIEENESRKDAVESLNLVLSGLVSVFSKFMTNFEDKDVELVLSFWKKLMQYFESMFQLNWKTLNLKIFQSYQDLIQVLASKRIPEELEDLLFEFWVNVSIDYDFVNPEYQDSLAVYNASFKPLYQIVKERLEYGDVSKVVTNLNKCARYPVLKSNLNDTTKPTELQKSVLDNLLLIDKKGDDEDILAGVIQQLALISSYPYETRGRIEAKLKSIEGNKLRIPSFIAISELALEMLSSKLQELEDISVLLTDNGFNKLVRSLLFLVHYKAEGIVNSEKDPLWVRCNNLIVYLVKRLLKDNVDDVRYESSVWNLIVECITVCFNKLTEQQEKYNVAQYDQLAPVVLPILFSGEVDQGPLVEDFVHKVYKHSYLYEMNDIELELVGVLLTGQPKDIESAYQALADFPFDESFGTTAPLAVYDNSVIRLKCLEELFLFANSSNQSSEIAIRCIITRSAFTLRRFTADERLLLKKPLPKIQQDEFSLILHGLQTIQLHASPGQLAGIYKLLSQTVPYVTRIENIPFLVEAILVRAE